jgi:hypothetical protein
MQTLQFLPPFDGFLRRYKIFANGRAMFCFNPGEANRDEVDFNMKRPSIHPLDTPAGFPVTEQGAHNFPHHKGCWIAHGNLSGTNFYHDGWTGGRLLTRTLHWSERDGVGLLDARIEWVDAAGNITLNERRRHWVRPSAQANRIVIRTELTPPLQKVEFAAEKHAFFHVRPIDAIDEDDGGSARASNGIVGASKIFSTRGLWMDCRGAIDGNKVGVCIMAHPSEGELPLFARRYGPIALKPFFEKAMTLSRGETFRRTFSILAYDGDADIEAAFHDFGATQFE